MDTASMKAGVETLRYEGGSPEYFYERMSQDLIARHGPLVSVDFASHFPKFEIWFCYTDGTKTYSGERTGDYDIHYLALGYGGTGPNLAKHFLDAAGFILNTDQIHSMKEGDSIRLESGKTVIKQEKDKLVTNSKVTFVRKEVNENLGYMMTYRYYKAPSIAVATQFLEEQNISEQHYYVIVETPEGNIAKDRVGIYDP